MSLEKLDRNQYYELLLKLFESWDIDLIVLDIKQSLLPARLKWQLLSTIEKKNQQYLSKKKCLEEFCLQADQQALLGKKLWIGEKYDFKVLFWSLIIKMSSEDISQKFLKSEKIFAKIGFFLQWHWFDFDIIVVSDDDLVAHELREGFVTYFISEHISKISIFNLDNVSCTENQLCDWILVDMFAHFISSIYDNVLVDEIEKYMEFTKIAISKFPIYSNSLQKIYVFLNLLHKSIIDNKFSQEKLLKLLIWWLSNPFRVLNEITNNKLDYNKIISLFEAKFGVNLMKQKIQDFASTLYELLNNMEFQASFCTEVRYVCKNILKDSKEYFSYNRFCECETWLDISTEANKLKLEYYLKWLQDSWVIERIWWKIKKNSTINILYSNWIEISLKFDDCWKVVYGSDILYKEVVKTQLEVKQEREEHKRSDGWRWSVIWETILSSKVVDRNITTSKNIDESAAKFEQSVNAMSFDIKKDSYSKLYTESSDDYKYSFEILQTGLNVNSPNVKFLWDLFVSNSKKRWLITDVIGEFWANMKILRPDWVVDNIIVTSDWTLAFRIKKTTVNKMKKHTTLYYDEKTVQYGVNGEKKIEKIVKLTNSKISHEKISSSSFLDSDQRKNMSDLLSWLEEEDKKAIERAKVGCKEFFEKIKDNEVKSTLNFIRLQIDQQQIDLPESDTSSLLYGALVKSALTKWVDLLNEHITKDAQEAQVHDFKKYLYEEISSSQEDKWDYIEEKVIFSRLYDLAWTSKDWLELKFKIYKWTNLLELDSDWRGLCSSHSHFDKLLFDYMKSMWFDLKRTDQKWSNSWGVQVEDVVEKSKIALWIKN